MVDALRTCANTIANTDQWMLQLQEYVGRHQWTVLFSGHIPQVCEAHLPVSLLTTAFHTCTNAKAGPSIVQIQTHIDQICMALSRTQLSR